MANTNTTTNVVDTVLAQGLLALREQAIMPRLVNRDYENVPADQYSAIQIPVPSAISAASVTPSNTPPDDSGVSPTKVTLTLDQWYEAPFFLNDKELEEIHSSTLGIQQSEAVKAIANNVDDAILALKTDLYSYAGVAATTPFGTDAGEYLDARALLNNEKAPFENRFMVINADADANAMGLRGFQDAAWVGSSDGIINGNIGHKLGADWFLDQNIPSHTAGTGSSATTDASGYAAGVTTLTLASAGTGTILAGDVVTFAGDTQTYLITTGDADVSGGGTIVFTPALKVAIAASATAITIKQTHVNNLLFHRDCFALAMRAFDGADAIGLGNFRSAVDPISGLVMRVEVSRQHRRTRWAYDVLYGVKTVRAEYGCRVAG